MVKATKVAKGGKRRNAVQDEKAARPVRLDLSDTDHVRLERCAQERGLSKASFARMAVLERIQEIEERKAGK
jgi:hypothetical protein